MVTLIVGDLLTGRRIQTLPVVAAEWSDTLNDSGSLSATVKLNNPDVQLLGLKSSASPGKAFLAVVDGDAVLQAGPIWWHDYDGNNQSLTIRASGMWSYFDHRMLIPVLDGFLPTDALADTNLTSSLQGIARALVAQAQSWTDGDVPVNLPAEVAGSNVRNYRGADLATVGQRLRELTQVEGGPDIRFAPRFTTDRLGVEWDLLIGTPDQPLLFSAFETVFNVGLKGSSVSDLRIKVDGSAVAGQAFATGGRASDEALVAVAAGTELSAAGFPLLELVDSSRSTITDVNTLQGFANELVLKGARPVESWTFTHDLSSAPALTGFVTGDFAKVRVHSDLYADRGEYRMRILSRSGDVEGRKVKLTFQPTDSFTPFPTYESGYGFGVGPYGVGPFGGL